MLKVAIIGCGKQADAHATVIRDLPNCELTAVCDTEELMAKQLSERFNAKRYFSDVHAMLDGARPDVVHIITPPHGHLALGKLCLNAGCHVFFEKPFTLNAREAADVLELATKRRLKVTVGHNNQFNHVSVRMREMIAGGFLGGQPVHMESNWCYDMGDKVFAKAMLSNKSHWVRSLPGRLLHNIISHGIGRIAEFMTGDRANVMAHGFCSPLVQSVGETEIKDELRVIIADAQNTTAYFTFSSQIYPRVQQFRVCGPKGSILIDDMHQTLTTVVNTNYKYYLNHFVPPALYARQYFANGINNMRRFMRSDFHFESGRKRLIEAFYRSITDDAPLPLTFREILLVARVMDEIFEQISRGAFDQIPETVDMAG